MVANRKPREARQDNAPSRELASVTAISGGALEQERHPPGVGWLKATKEQWDVLWDSSVAQAIGAHHLPVLYRLFEMRDAQNRALRLYKRRPMVEGSMGQPVVNPSMATVNALEKSIVALEDRLGLTPKAQANLGISIGQARLTAAELNRMAEEEDEDDSRSSGAGDELPDDVVEGDAWEQA